MKSNKPVSVRLAHATRLTLPSAGWARPTRGRGRRPLPQRALRCEPLEDRRMLSVAAGGENALELFSTSTALFVENQGQWADEAVRYGFQGDGVNIAFTDDGLAFRLSQQTAATNTPAAGNSASPDRSMVRQGADIITESAALPDRLDAPDDDITHSTQFTVQFDGANDATPVGLDQAETRFNYFVGDQSKWASNVPGYEVVAYENLYAGIDLHTFGRRDSLKYEFYVAPGADYRQIDVSYDGIDGLWIDDAGVLHVETELGELVDDAPYIYQIVAGREVEVAGQFALVDDDTYTFEITGAYDPHIELVIDPDLAWSTYLGGSHDESIGDIAVDASGSVYVMGSTSSGDFPTTTGTAYIWQDFFVAKLSSAGSLVYATYLGGSQNEWGQGGIAVDANGAAYVTGRTGSTDFPTTSGAYDTSHNGGFDVFVAKLSTDGSLVSATYFGGSLGENSAVVAVDAAGSIWVSGSTESTDFPTTAGAYDRTFNGVGLNDAFVAKFSSGGALVYSTYLGGTGSDWGRGIAVDAAGAAFVIGETSSSDFPTTNGAYDTNYHDGYDVYVAKLSSSGVLVYSTYVGGAESDWGRDIAVDSDGAAYITGGTASTDFPTTAGAYDTSLNGVRDAFIAKLSSDGGALVYATYLGGSDVDSSFGIAVDTRGSGYVIGTTESTDFPMTAGAYDTSYNGEGDAFLAKLSHSGALVYATYLGGSTDDAGNGIAVAPDGAVYVAGGTESTDFPTTAGAYDRSHNGRTDAFLAKFTLTDMLPGDFNGDGTYDDLDIDELVAAIASGTHPARYDLTNDTRVDLADRDAWLAQAGSVNLGPGRSYLLGDANLDGVVDVSDFTLWNNHKFTANAAWSAGDFNADGVVDVSDFQVWNNHKFTSAYNAMAKAFELGARIPPTEPFERRPTERSERGGR